MINKNFMSTYSKIRFNPTTPTPDNIIIEDIAHALSLMVRANGHFKIFYSVAQHCIACCKEAKLLGYNSFIQLTCLLHDASEAYISDIIRPLKRQLDDYNLYETQLENIIYNKFLKRLPTEYEYSLVKEIDNAMLYHEFKIFHGDILSDEEPKIMYHIPTKFIDFQNVEKEYILLYNNLSQLL